MRLRTRLVMFYGQMNVMRHKNYEILNLIGYGLSKFNNDFIKEFGFNTKTDFYNFCVENGIASTVGTVKNRMDLFDCFFPDNGRRGWWQKGDAYIHRKIFIDNLFGNEDAVEYVNTVKMLINDRFTIKGLEYQEKPIIRSRFKKLQETGLEAELFFINNYESVDIFKNGALDDARLYGDGYDFQISIGNHSYLTEIKGIRENKGKFRLTENEYNKALDYKEDYIVAVVLNLNTIPEIVTIKNPVNKLRFKEKIVFKKEIREYHLLDTVG